MKDASAEFDPAEVARIIEDALRDSKYPHASFIDVQVFEALDKLLPKYMNSADASYLLDSIRRDIYDGFSIPSSEKLHKLIAQCKKCADEFDVSPQNPQWNLIDPDLLIVAVNPEAVRNHGELLAKSLHSAGFKSDRCCLTYVTRCPVDKPSSNCIKSCAAYLHTEIHALKPKLIVALGIESYVAVTGNSNEQMKSIHGKIHWFGMYPIVVQHSPGYFAYLAEKTNTDATQYASVFKQAHSFIYGS